MLDEEQAVMDDHEHKIAEITEHLQQLCPESKVTSSAEHSGHSHNLRRWLNDVERNLCLVQGKIDPLISSPHLDSCLILQLEEQVSSIKLDHSDIPRGFVSSKKKVQD